MLTCEEAKRLGNECMSVGDYVEALQHYTRAISLSPKDAALYSNRSFAFLKLNQPARALVDAEDALRRRPNWAKGYFRKAEALRAAGLHAEAVGIYARGSDLDPSDDHLREQCDASRLRAAAQARAEWLWVAVGAALGLALLAVLAAAPDINSSGVNGPGVNSPGGARRRPAGLGLGLAGRAAAAAAGAVLGGGIGLGWRAVRAHGRRGSVLPPLESNDRFVAMQGGGTGPSPAARVAIQGGGGGPGPDPAPDARRGWGAAPVWAEGEGGGGGTAEGGGLGAGAGGKAGAKHRSVKHGRAAALRAMGKAAPAVHK